MDASDTPEVERESSLEAIVSWEPCAVFVAHHESDGICAACGWLAADHEEATATVAVFRRPQTVRLERRAS